MVDIRINKSVGERVNIEFNRKPNALLRRRRIVTWAVFAAALAAMGFLLAQNDKRVYWAGELSPSHKIFQNDCQQCHDQRFQPAVRFAKFDDAVHSVSTDACRSCHSNFHHRDHNRYITDHDERFVHNCVVCHKEHQGDVSLSWISDSHCVNCHGDLNVQGARPNYFPQITSFDDHPEFALHRKPNGSIGPEHLVSDVAVRGSEGAWVDPARIKFNHYYHLDPGGLPVPPGHPEYGDGTVRKKLTCGSCHQPDDAGRYMQPIRYETHCSECHRLEYRTELSLAGNKQSQPLPHASPEVIRGALRDRLMAYANAFPEKLDASSAGETDEPESSEPRHPNKSRATQLSAKDKWTWVEDKISRMERAIAFRTSGDRKPPEHDDNLLMPTDDVIGHVQTGCAHCHFVDRPQETSISESDLLANWSIVPPSIPSRWLRHSHFDHSKHVEVADIFYGPAGGDRDQPLSIDDRSCLVCHDPRGAHDPGSRLGDDPDRFRLSSEKTADILMPSIKVCQACHAKSEAGQKINSGHARDSCVECHKYHHPDAAHPRMPKRLVGADAK